MREYQRALLGLLTLLASNTFALCVLAAVSATALLGLVLGAEIELVIALLVLGGVTALAETQMRTKQ